MTFVTTREQRRELKRQNAKWPATLQRLSADQWPDAPAGMTKTPAQIWWSRYFLVQEFGEKDGIRRLSVARSEIDAASGRWKDGISWEELQEIKRQIGLGDCMAVEIFPADRDVVNVANMRHLWVLPAPLPFGWRKS